MAVWPPPQNKAALDEVRAGAPVLLATEVGVKGRTSSSVRARELRLAW